MSGRARVVILAAVVSAAVGAAFVYEMVRVRPALTDPVTSPLPSNPEEAQRLEEGFQARTRRAGRPVFDLDGRSMYRLESGAQILHGVERLAIYLEDGRVVEVEADRGLLQQVGRESDEVTVELEGTVRVQDPDGVTLETEKLVYDASRRALSAVGTAFIRGDGFKIRASSLLYRPEGRIAEGLDSVTLWLGEDDDWVVDAEHAVYRIAVGEVSFDRPVRTRFRDLDMLSGPSTYRLADEGAPGRFETEEGALVVAGEGDEVLQLAAAGMVAVDAGGVAAAAQVDLRGVETGNPSSLVHRRLGAEGVETLLVASDGWRLVPGEEGGPTVARAGPSFLLEARSAEGEIEAEGRWLDLTRGADGRLESVVATEEVVVRASEGTEAEGDSLTWLAETPGEIVIEGAPARALKGDDLIEAPRLRLLDDEQVLLAEGPVLAEIERVGSGPSLFNDREPVRVRSSEARIPADDGEIVFSGAVQAYQGTSSLRATTLRILREEEVLYAEERVSLRLERASGDGSSIVRVSADLLEYVAATRTATFRGNVRYEEYQGAVVGAVVSSRSMLVAFGENDEIDAVTASEDVRLEHEAKSVVGRADRLEWQGGRAGRAILIGEKSLAQLESSDPEEPGTMKAGRIAYDFRTGAATIDSAPGRRGTIESQPPSGGDEKR